MMCMRYGFYLPEYIQHTCFTYSHIDYCYTHNTAENNYIYIYIYISPPAVLWFAFHFCSFLFQYFFCVISLIIDSFNCMPFFPTHIHNRIHETACLFLFTGFFFFYFSLLFFHSFIHSSVLSFLLFNDQTWLNLQLHSRCSTCVHVSVCERTKLTRHVCIYNCVTHTTAHIFHVCMCLPTSLVFPLIEIRSNFKKNCTIFSSSSTYWKFHFQIY